MAKKEKYQFLNPEQSSMKFLICPDCREYISCIDIEAFSNCPFCNHQLPRDPELEDFVLQPVIERWVRQFVNHS